MSGVWKSRVSCVTTGVNVCYGLLLFMVASRAAEANDTCLMTLVVPKEKIKHTCDVQEQFQKKLEYLEGQINHQAKVIKDLEVMLRKDKPIVKHTKKPSVFQVNPGLQVSRRDEEDLYMPPVLPDLSDDYPDFPDYYPPDVSSRADKGKPRKEKLDQRKGINLFAMDLLRPYVDRELAKLKVNISRTISQRLHPFAAGFEEVKKFTLQNGSRDANTPSPGAQTSMNTIALSHLFVQVSNVHDKLLHMNTQHLTLQKKVSVMESRLISLHNAAGQRTTDLRSRILQLEHENRLLKLNQTCHSELQEIRLDIARQLSNAKDTLRGNCKSRRRTKVRARIAQEDYYYDEDADDDNVIDDTAKPLTETSAFMELAKNVTALQNLMSQQFQRLEDANSKSLAAWNSTEIRLREEVMDRRHVDNLMNTTSHVSLEQLRKDIGSLDGDLKEVRNLADQMTQDIEENHRVTEQQLASLRQVLADLHRDTINNFTHHRELVKNTSWTIGMSIHKLQKADEEHSQALKAAVGKSNQKLTENRLSILEWRDRVTENNASLSHLSTDLRQLSEQVHVSVLSLNESVRTLSVQFKLNNETWYPYSFSHTKGHVKCFGEKYVRKTNYPSGSIVGVVLCSPDMYKIFLSDSLTDTFLDVADSDGYGHDHCEFVGGKLERTSQLGNTPVFYKRQMGKLNVFLTCVTSKLFKFTYR